MQVVESYNMIVNVYKALNLLNNPKLGIGLEFDRFVQILFSNSNEFAEIIKNLFYFVFEVERVLMSNLYFNCTLRQIFQIMNDELLSELSLNLVQAEIELVASKINKSRARLDKDKIFSDDLVKACEQLDSMESNEYRPTNSNSVVQLKEDQGSLLTENEERLIEELKSIDNLSELSIRGKINLCVKLLDLLIYEGAKYRTFIEPCLVESLSARLKIDAIKSEKVSLQRRLASSIFVEPEYRKHLENLINLRNKELQELELRILENNKMSQSFQQVKPLGSYSLRKANEDNNEEVSLIMFWSFDSMKNSLVIEEQKVGKEMNKASQWFYISCPIKIISIVNYLRANNHEDVFSLTIQLEREAISIQRANAILASSHGARESEISNRPSSEPVIVCIQNAEATLDIDRQIINQELSKVCLKFFEVFKVFN